MRRETNKMKVEAKRSETLSSALYNMMFIGATIGFSIGTYQSWSRYQGEPLSTLSTENELDESLNLPSFTLCYFVASSAVNAELNTNYTLEDLKQQQIIQLIGFGFKYVTTSFQRDF